MEKKRVLLVTHHPLLRESLRSLPMPRVEVLVAERLPVDGNDRTGGDVDADVWIVDASVISTGDELCRLFRGAHAPSRIILVAMDSPQIIVVTSHVIGEEDAAGFLENIILS